MKSKSFVPAIVLAGGLGTRLRDVSGDLPKPMVEVLGKPFLYWLIKSLESAGFRHLILSVGHKAQIIVDYPWPKEFENCHFEIIKEEKLLGTGGAIKNIFDLHQDISAAWVVNGDTILENPLPPHCDTAEDVVYVGLERDLVFDAQPNLITKENRVIEIADGRGDIFDGGQVFVKREALNDFESEPPYSLHTLFRKSLKQGRVGFKITPGTCFDIGTPQRLQRFKNYLKTKITRR